MTPENFGTQEFVFLFLSLVTMMAMVSFLVTLKTALVRCARSNRTMRPALVWLLLIPVFNLVWQFVVVTAVSNSMAREFEMRGIEKGQSPGKGLGIVFCVMAFISFFVPTVGFIAYWVVWIIYWITIIEFSRELVKRPRRLLIGKTQTP